MNYALEMRGKMKSKLTADTIYEKQFKSKRFGGLDPEDVDNFLNLVIEDYEYFEKTFDELSKQIESLREENFRLNMGALKEKSSTLDMSNDIEIHQLTQTNDFGDETKRLDDTKDINDSSIEQRLAKVEKQVAELLKENKTQF